jgi:hypothetical protein
VFTPNLREQLPTDLETLVPEGHIVRAVREAVEKADLGPVPRQRKGGLTAAAFPLSLSQPLG